MTNHYGELLTELTGLVKAHLEAGCPPEAATLALIDVLFNLKMERYKTVEAYLQLGIHNQFRAPTEEDDPLFKR